MLIWTWKYYNCVVKSRIDQIKVGIPISTFFRFYLTPTIKTHIHNKYNYCKLYRKIVQVLSSLNALLNIIIIVNLYFSWRSKCLATGTNRWNGSRDSRLSYGDVDGRGYKVAGRDFSEILKRGRDINQLWDNGRGIV